MRKGEAMDTMTIKDHVTGQNVEVEVLSSEQVHDGTLHTVHYAARTSAEVDCTFSVIEHADGLACQDDWQGRPATADDIEETNWADCTPVDDGMIDVSEASVMLGVSRQRIHQLLHDGKIDGRKIGKTWYVYRWSVEDRMEASGR